MLDIKFIKENQETVKAGIKARGSDPGLVDRVLKVNETRLQLIADIENIRANRNKLVRLSVKGRPEKSLLVEGKKLKEVLRRLEPDLKAVEQELQKLLYEIPNLPSDDTPLGKSEADNLELKAWLPDKGYLPKTNIGIGWVSKKYMPAHPPHAKDKNFKPQPHYLLAPRLGVDMEQAAKTSGSRFTYLKGEVVVLQYALFELVKTKLLQEKFMPMIVPLLVKDWVLSGTSHFPQGEDQVYKIAGQNVETGVSLNLVGSSEPSLFGYYAGKTLKHDDLPIKMFAYSSCFRSEAGSWGKDVRGIKRVHQFDKLEMDIVCRPDQSAEMFDYLLSLNEWLLQSLELPYRLWLKSTGDMGYHASHKQCDPEAWFPASGEFVEIGTDTNTSDYQARRMNIKFTDKNGTRQFCHTVNDTGVAMGRMILAILENYQQKDGSVLIPKVLQKYTGFKKISPKS